MANTGTPDDKNDFTWSADYYLQIEQSRVKYRIYFDSKEEALKKATNLLYKILFMHKFKNVKFPLRFPTSIHTAKGKIVYTKNDIINATNELIENI